MRHFRPEFLNRLDESIVFHSLNRDELSKIVELQIERFRNRLMEKNLKLDITQSVLDWIANKGYDPVYGARPLKRAIQKEIETPMAKFILAGNYLPDQTIRIDIKDDKLFFQ